MLNKHLRFSLLLILGSMAYPALAHEPYNEIISNGVFCSIYQDKDRSIASQVLVLVHGLKSSSENFNEVLPLLRGHYTLIVCDQKGHGRSQEGVSHYDYSPHRLAEDLHGVIEYYRRKTDFTKFSKVHLLGHSFGAKTVLAFVKDHPDLVRSVILEDMGVYARDVPLEEKAVFLHAQKQMDQYRDQFGSREAVEGFLRDIYGSSESTQYYRYIRESRDEDGCRSFKLAFKPHVATLYSYFCKLSDFSDVIKAARVPLMVLKAGRESAISTGEASSILREAPESIVSIQSVPMATHNIHRSQPELFSEYVKNHVNMATAFEMAQINASFKRSESPRHSSSPVPSFGVGLGQVPLDPAQYTRPPEGFREDREEWNPLSIGASVSVFGEENSELDSDAIPLWSDFLPTRGGGQKATHLGFPKFHWD